MKKILLATTILALSAGYASAEITWGASAAAGIANEGKIAGGTAAEITTATALVASTKATAIGNPTDANLAAYEDAIAALAEITAADAGDFEVYSSANLSVTLSGATDGGLTFGATFDTTAGRSYALGDDDGFGDEGGSFGMPTVWIAGTFGKLAISDDNFDMYDDANGGGDVQYTNTFGAVSVGLIADVDSNDTSISLGYTAGNLALSANMDTYELYNVSAAYTLGSIVITAATNEASESSLKVAYTAANGMTASGQYNTSDESIDVAAGYSANGLSLNADTNTVSNHWTVTAGYDLGGGLSVKAGTNYTQDMMIGAEMSF